MFRNPAGIGDASRRLPKEPDAPAGGRMPSRKEPTLRIPPLVAALLVALATLGLSPSASAHYDPNLGRWLERDPNTTPNRYSALLSNPFHYRDAAGLAEETASGDDHGVVPWWMPAQAVEWGLRYVVGSVATGCTQVDLTLVGGPIVDPQEGAEGGGSFLREAKDAHPAAIEVSDLRDMLAKLRERIDQCKTRSLSCCCCIRTLTLIGHGAAGEINVGGWRACHWTERPNNILWWFDSPLGVNTNLDRLADLKSLLCDEATIVFFGCHTAAGRNGMGLLEKAVRVLDSPWTTVTAKGYTGAVYSNGQYSGEERSCCDKDLK